MTNKPMLSVERGPVAWAVEISGCLKFFDQKKSAENARRRYEKVMDAERMEPFPLYAEQPAPVADGTPRQDKEDMLYDCAYRNGVMFGYGIGINGTEDDYQKCINRLQEQIVEARRLARLNGVKP